MSTISENIRTGPLQHALQNVPRELKDWFGSESITYKISELNKRFNFTGGKIGVIPRSTLRLEVKDLSPKNFTETISNELGISPSSARGLAKEISQKILEPMKRQLLDWGVDISLIDTNTVDSPSVNVTMPAQNIPSVKMEVSEITEQAPKAPAETTGPRATISVVKGVPSIAPAETAPVSTQPSRISIPAQEPAKKEVVPPRVVQPPPLPKIEPAAQRTEIKKPAPETPPPTKLWKSDEAFRTLKKEGESVKLREDKPFMLHEEVNISKVKEAEVSRSGFQSNTNNIPGDRPVSRTAIPLAPKSPSFEIESAYQEPKKPVLKSTSEAPKKIVNYSESDFIKDNRSQKSGVPQPANINFPANTPAKQEALPNKPDGVNDPPPTINLKPPSPPAVPATPTPHTGTKLDGNTVDLR